MERKGDEGKGEAKDVDDDDDEAKEGEEERLIGIIDTLVTDSQSEWTVEEEEFIWALVAWKKARDSLNRAKLSRRFPSLDPSKKPDLSAAMKRVKCWNCGARGHISKDCGEKRRSDRRPKGSGKGKRQ